MTLKSKIARWIKRKIFLQKFVYVVTNHFYGVKSGKKYGMKLSTVARSVEETKQGKILKSNLDNIILPKSVKFKISEIITFQ